MIRYVIPYDGTALRSLAVEDVELNRRILLDPFLIHNYVITLWEYISETGQNLHDDVKQAMACEVCEPIMESFEGATLEDCHWFSFLVYRVYKEMERTLSELNHNRRIEDYMMVESCVGYDPVVSF